MLVVITHHAPVVTGVQRMVDVGKVVPSHLTLRIDPNFTSKLAISTLLRDVVRIVDDFSISHDALYHGCPQVACIDSVRGRIWHRRPTPAKSGGDILVGVFSGVLLISKIGKGLFHEV